MICPTCCDSHWVCQAHGTHPSGIVYDGPEACDEGPGRTCPTCNPMGWFPGFGDMDGPHPLELVILEGGELLWPVASEV